MPSGAKRRKAAKKKKGIEANINSSTNPHENDVLNSQDGDGGEVSSYSNNEVERIDTSSARSFVPENSSVDVDLNGEEDAQKVDEEDVSVVDFDSELKQDSELNDVDVEHVNKSICRSSSSSSSNSSSSHSSSDHESRVIEQNLVGSEPEKLKEETYNPVLDDDAVTIPDEEEFNSIAETEPAINLIKLDKPAFEKVVPLNEGTYLLEESANFDSADLCSVEKDEQLLPSLEEKTIELNETEKMILPLSYKTDEETSSANVVTTKEKEDELLQLQVSSAPVVEPVIYSEILECSENQPLLVSGAPQQVKTTSWKSCCGLFDVLSGSNR